MGLGGVLIKRKYLHLYSHYSHHYRYLNSEVKVHIWGCDSKSTGFSMYSAKYCRSWLDANDKEIQSISKPNEPCEPFTYVCLAVDMLTLDVEVEKNGCLKVEDQVIIREDIHKRITDSD